MKSAQFLGSAQRNAAQRQAYEDERRETTATVSRIIAAHADGIAKTLGAEAGKFASSLWNRRRFRAERHGRLRDWVVMTTLKMNGIERLTQDHLAVIAAGEFYNMASYYQNWHLDGKHGVSDGLEGKLCHVTSHLYREKANELIVRTNFPDSIRLKLLDGLSESNRAIQQGQAGEFSGFRIEDLKSANETKIVASYARRCLLLTGEFYGFSFAMGPIMAGADPEPYRRIGRLFGTGLQMINDVGDFCLDPDSTSLPEKDYQDQFADLEKGTMTLPVYELGKIADLHSYAGRLLGQEEKEHLLALMVDNKCFHSTRRMTNKILRDLRKELHTLPANPRRDELSYATKLIFQSNKFYVGLRENHGYVWGV